MNVSKLTEILSTLGAKEVTLMSNSGMLTVYSKTEGFETYSEIDSEISLPKITVDVSQFLEALKRAEGAELVLTYSDSKLILKTENMHVELSVREGGPVAIPIIPGDEYFETINFEGLKTALSKTVDAASKDRARPHLAAVTIDDNKVMATDSFAMAVYNMIEAPNIFKDKKFTLNSDFVKHILKIGKKERTANIYLTKDLFYVKLGDTIFISRRGEPLRMDYNRILNESLQADHNALITTCDLKKALKSLKPTLKQEGNWLNFSFKENKVILKAGSFNLDIPSVYNSEPRQVTLDSRYIEVFLKTAGAFMNIAIKNENAPVVLIADDSYYNFVLMPIRTR